jgi:hypothetical protein
MRGDFMLKKGFKVTLVGWGLFLAINLQAAPLTFGENAPAQYFAENPEARSEFLQQVEGDDDLSEQQKLAYQSLLGTSEVLAGDDVLEILDADELAWFYGWDQAAKASGDSIDLLHPAAKITENVNLMHYRDCLGRAMCVMVSKSSQRVYAFVDGDQIMLNEAGAGATRNPQPFARVSTARPGKITPEGFFTVQELANADRVSSLYSGAALYYAMQIYGHIFIHATSPDHYAYLGSPASAGCVRTRFGVAEQLNHLMRHIGGRESGVLKDPNSVRVIVDRTVPNLVLSVY